MTYEDCQNQISIESTVSSSSRISRKQKNIFFCNYIQILTSYHNPAADWILTKPVLEKCARGWVRLPDSRKPLAQLQSRAPPPPQPGEVSYQSPGIVLCCGSCLEMWKIIVSMHANEKCLTNTTYLLDLYNWIWTYNWSLFSGCRLYFSSWSACAWWSHPCVQRQQPPPPPPSARSL